MISKVFGARRFLRCFRAMSFIFLAWAWISISKAQEELFTKVDITEEILTCWVDAWYGAGYGSSPGAAKALCDSTLSYYGQSDFNDVVSICVIGDDGMTWLTERLDKSFQFQIDLRDYTNYAFQRVVFEWDATLKRSGTTLGKTSYDKELKLDELNLIDTIQFSTAWTPAGSSTHCEFSSPRVYGYIQNSEIEKDEIRADEEKANKGDPVNTITGNTSLDETDIVIPCPGIPIMFRRAYNSAMNGDGPLGHRWTHSYNMYLLATNTVFDGATNNWQVLVAGDGASYWFREQTNQFDSPSGKNWLLTYANNEYLVTVPGELVYAFNTNGVLQTVSNSAGNALTLSYSGVYPSNLLTRVQHNNELYLDLHYQDNRLITVDTPTTNVSVTYSYNGLGQLTNVGTILPGAAYSTAYFYDNGNGNSNHSLTQRVNAAGTRYQWYYATNEEGHVTSKATESRVATNFLQTVFDYGDTNDNLTTVAQVRGDTNIVYEYYYDPILKLIENIRGPNSYTNWSAAEKGIRYRYDDSGNETNAVTYDNEAGQWTEVMRLYDEYHHVTKEAKGFCSSPSNVWEYTWNEAQLLASITDPEGCKVGFEYVRDQMSKVKFFFDTSNAYETTFSYTTAGLLAGITNANGHWIQHTYDSYGFPASAVPQAGPTVNYQYSQLGHLTNISLPGEGGNRIIAMDVNELGRINKITYPDGLNETFSRDAIGNVTGHVDRAGRVTTFAYLPTRKLSSVTTQLGTNDVTVGVTYDLQFNTLVIRDALNRSVESYVLDIQDRPMTVTNLEGQTLSVTYGVADYVKSITRFDGTTVNNEYNTDGWLSKASYPDTTNTFGYLKNGLLRTAMNSEGTVSNTYDGANRLTQVSSLPAQSGFDPQLLSVSYGYFPAGQVSNVTSVAGSTTYEIDAADRISSIQVSSLIPQPFFHYSYNPNNGLVSRVVCTNSGVTVDYGYDVMDRVTNIVWNNTATNVIRSFAYQYDNAGMITNIALENGTRLAYEYDDLDRLTSETCHQGSSIQNQASYSYDEVGNRVQKTRGGIAVSYTYSNGCNRLLGWSATSTNDFADLLRCEVSGSSSEIIGTNPALGQCWVSPSTGSGQATNGVTPHVEGTNFSVVDFAVSPGTQVIVAAIGDEAGNVGYATNTVVVNVFTNGSYGFNTAGCVTSIVYQGSASSETLSLTWNGQYQLTVTSTNGVECERNGFDALGRRVWTWDSQAGEANVFVYDGIQVVADLNYTGGLVRSYVWGPGIDNLLAMTVHTGVTAKAYFTLTDHLGTVHALTDTNGVIVESYRFDAFGRVLGVYNGAGQLLTQSAVGNRFLWAGKEYSFKTGLYHNRHRVYDPVTGRFLSKDPSGISGGLHEYLYANGNTINFVDFDGLRDVNVYVWRARGIIINPNGSAGHIMVTEYKSADPKDVILSQFPHKRGEPRTSEGPNSLLNWRDTYAVMGRPPDEIYTVFVPDDKAFDSEACKQRKHSAWNWRPTTPNQTHCSRAAYDALRAGGVPVPENPGQAMPGTLGDELKKLIGNSKAKLRVGF